MILIVYTTQYRTGGDKFARAAETLRIEKTSAYPGREVACIPVESKADFVAAIQRGETITELHFIGHSGMYGPMFRTMSMPEQFSPHEWRTLKIPFAQGGQAYFHACRTARWFAPFFARTFQVPAHGYHWYTTVSARSDRFQWEGRASEAMRPLYIRGCPGKKSHGLLGSLAKYTAGKLEPMKRFDPAPLEGDASYDSVAALYDDAFADITVRKAEWNWINAHLPPAAEKPRVLDIGCGNGSLLLQLQDRIGPSVGADASAGMIARAQARQSRHVSFTAIDGPALPFPDASFDVVTSLLSFRYLDWDPIMCEIRRVLRPGGKLLVVDMVTAPVSWRDAPKLVAGKTQTLLALGSKDQRFATSLKKLVKDPRWHTMLRYNPIRAQHEFTWYLESRFPGQKVETLDVGWNARVLAFDSGPWDDSWVAPQSYP